MHGIVRISCAVVIGLAAVLAVACGGTGAESARPLSPKSPESDQTAAPQATVRALPAALPALSAAPAVGAPCPFEQGACDFAVTVLEAVRSGDSENLLAIASPRTYACPAPADDRAAGRRSICEGAAEGERRPGYTNVHGSGTGLATLEQFDQLAYARVRLAASADAALADGYGTGEVRIAGIGCALPPVAGEARCAGGLMEVTLTSYSPAANFDAAGRVTFQVYLQVAPGGGYGVFGLGETAPPETALYDARIPVSGERGKVTFDHRAWSPA